MSLQTAHINTMDRRLQRAYKHVNELWLPPNPQLMRKIKDGLKDGIYDLDIDFLISEIKTDLALFTYCLREISKLVKEEKTAFPALESPIQIMHWAGLKRLSKILEVDETDISSHSLEMVDDYQASRLKEAMISASAAEVLSQYNQLDPDFGFSAAVLRQLGMALIAWNYPGVYERALAVIQEKPKQTLDNALSEILGFSPGLLATTLLKEWGYSPMLQAAVDIDSTNTAGLTQAGRDSCCTFNKLCEIGEALARANDPDRYPSAHSDWTAAREALETHLGFEGLKLIQTKVAEHCVNYARLIPDTFGAQFQLDPEVRLRRVKEESILKRNPFLKACPIMLRKKLRDLYTQMNFGEISRDAINVLVKQIIPFSGFSGGCVFTVDPGTMQLVPRLKFGVISQIEVRAVNLQSTTDTIATSFNCQAPIVESSEISSKEKTSYICGALGNIKKVGVLYLEIPKTQLSGEDSSQLTNFKALRQTLCDCLNLS